MKYIYLLAHTMGPFMGNNGSMVEDWQEGIQFDNKEDATKYLEDNNLYRTLYVQTLIVSEVK